MRNYKIAAIPADGIGPEVIECGVQALRALARRDGDLAFAITPIDWGSDHFDKHGEMMPKDGLSQLQHFDAIYCGAESSDQGLMPSGVNLGALWNVAQMLEDLSEHDAAQRLSVAIGQLCASGNAGGTATAKQVGAAVSAIILRSGALSRREQAAMA